MPLDFKCNWKNPNVCRFGLFQIISSIDELEEWLYDTPEVIALDFETCGDFSKANTPEEYAWIKRRGGLDTSTCQVLLTSLAYNNSACVIDHSTVDVKEALDMVSNKRIVVHNSSFEMSIIERITGRLPILEADTQDVYGLVTAGVRPTWSNLNRLALAVMCQHLLNVKLMKTVRDTFSSGLLDQNAMAYSAEDAYATILSYNILVKEMKKMGLEYTYYKIERPLSYGLLKLEQRGVDIDYGLAKTYENLLIEREDILTKKLEDKGLKNPRSNPVIIAFLKQDDYETETANHAFLSKISKDYEVADLLLRFRSVTKFRNGFLVPWTGKHYNGFTHRIHPSFTQTYVETGRLSCREPNMQQIPKGKYITELEDIDIRGLINPCEGNLFVTADYSQYELRVLAELSNDRRMIAEFFNEYAELLNLWEVMRINGVHKWQSEEVEKLIANDPLAGEIKHKLKFLDKHTQTAATIFDVQADEVTKAQRTQAKAVSFGIVYGMGPKSLAEGMSASMGRPVEIKEAKALLSKYFKKYPGVEEYLRVTKSTSLLQGWCSTPMGRSRRFPSVVCDIKNEIKSSLEREAANMTVQGSNGDVTKTALNDLFSVYKDRYPNIWPIMTIHDEIVTVCPEIEGNEVAAQVEKSMVEASKLVLRRVPTALGITLSNKWEKD